MFDSLVRNHDALLTNRVSASEVNLTSLFWLHFFVTSGLNFYRCLCFICSQGRLKANGQLLLSNHMWSGPFVRLGGFLLHSPFSCATNGLAWLPPAKSQRSWDTWNSTASPARKHCFSRKVIFQTKRKSQASCCLWVHFKMSSQYQKEPISNKNRKNECQNYCRRFERTRCRCLLWLLNVLCNHANASRMFPCPAYLPIRYQRRD